MTYEVKTLRLVTDEPTTLPDDQRVIAVLNSHRANETTSYVTVLIERP